VITSVAASLGPRSGAIVLDVRCDPVVLHVNYAAPLGLIVNELVTNAFKHGFSGRTQGTISVLLRREHGTVTLEVSDSGVELPVDFTLEHSDGLGLQIVQMLAAQLDATMEVVPSPATFRLMFKPPAKNS
jgi:two-component sensor histidine kinase